MRDKQTILSLNFKTMKSLIETTTGTLSSQMILDHCGEYAGKYREEAANILSELFDTEDYECEVNQWSDIMFDQNGTVYAIWGTGSLTRFNAEVKYIIQLDREDCPSAFADMDNKAVNY